jgi:hypothetical protein
VGSDSYHRYHIQTQKCPNIAPHPHRFKVKINRFQLAKLLIKELIHYWGQWDVIASRPCVYGVFSGPLGGFLPREKLCVGCLRCTTQYPHIAKILPNPDCQKLGDSYFTADQIDTVVREAESGRIPIRGAGYRGKFGGTGWDGMWTDMSEIVRPTRDGIHGREFISTQIDIGEKVRYLEFDSNLQIPAMHPPIHSIPIPLLFDHPPALFQANEKICKIYVEAARELQSFTILPFETLLKFELRDASVIPLLALKDLSPLVQSGIVPLLLEMDGWDKSFYLSLKSHFPRSVIILREEFDHPGLLSFYNEGIRVFHLTANYHGRNSNGTFVLDAIRAANQRFVEAGIRDEVTLIGSGGITAAEHLPKSILCGLDAVALDTPLMAALQAHFLGECVSSTDSRFRLPSKLTIHWGKQRLKNLAATWRDQMLEIMGAMGLREVRRMRGEMGRAMFQTVLEKEAFEGIEGYGQR